MDKAIKTWLKWAAVLIFVVWLFTVMGCGERPGPEVDAGRLVDKWCVDGVTYLYHRGSGYRAAMAVKLDRGGNVVLCGGDWDE
jgi:hypothetical protein